MMRFANSGYQDYLAQSVYYIFKSRGPVSLTIPFAPYEVKFGTKHGLWRQTNLHLNIGPFTY